MIIGIDANEANVTNKVGIGQYAFHILTNIEKLDKKNQYTIYLKNKPRKDLPKPRQNWQYKILGPSKLWTRLALPLNLFLSNPKPDVFLSLGHYSPLISPCPTIPVITDLGYLEYPQQFTKKDLYQLTHWTKQSIKKASHIITISKFTKNEIVKTYKIDPTKITIAPPAANPLSPVWITGKSINKVLNKYNIPPKHPYFLYMGTLKPSKNIPFLIKSFAQFSKKFPQYNLVIAGKKGWLFDDIFSTVKKLNIENKIIFTDFVTETEKWHLYYQSFTVVIPSLYEGFGMPALEAIAYGKTVIASKTTSLPEVVGDSDILINPTNINSLVRALTTLATEKDDQAIRRNIKAIDQSNKFSWTSSAQTIIDLFQKHNTNW